MTAVKVFINYAAEDHTFAEALTTHLVMLRRQGIVSQWSAANLDPDAVLTDQLSQQLQAAQVVLLLLSSNYLDNDTCWLLQEQAMAATKIVVPILLSPCQWQLSPMLAALSPLPTNQKPIKMWELRDEAYLHIAEQLQKQLGKEAATTATAPAGTAATATPTAKAASTTVSAQLLNRRYTCNRRLQREEFESKCWELADQKVIAYYIHGEEAQSTAGLYRCLRDIELMGNWSDRVIRRFERTIIIEPRSKLALFKIDFLQKLAKVFELNWQRTDLANANLLTLANSVGAQQFEVVTLGIEIDSRTWADGDMLGFFDWFNNQFCQVSLQPQHPIFVFFFMVDYYQNAATIAADLQTMISQTNPSPTLLPELSGVSLTDIEFWFRTVGLKDFAAQHQLAATYFAQPNSLNMRQVERQLEQIITQYNHLMSDMA